MDLPGSFKYNYGWEYNYSLAGSSFETIKENRILNRAISSLQLRVSAREVDQFRIFFKEIRKNFTKIHALVFDFPIPIRTKNSQHSKYRFCEIFKAFVVSKLRQFTRLTKISIKNLVLELKKMEVTFILLML